MAAILRATLLAALAASPLIACSSMEASNQERTASQSQPAMSEQQQLVEKARLTVQAVKTDPSFGNAPDLLRRARAVVVVPNLIKGGFFVGGEGGHAVMLTRQGTGWSNPAFYTLGSGSFGLQIGLEQAQVVMFAMTDKALNGLMQDQFKFGAQAGVSVLMLGSNVQGATTPKLDADIIVWAKSQGAYAGITLEGSILKPDAEATAAYYGRALTPREILLGGAVQNPRANALRQSLVVSR
jgi:lipid-binding SYLF domain-containing protein